jgi:hypothetical protein
LLALDGLTTRMAPCLWPLLEPRESLRVRFEEAICLDTSSNRESTVVKLIWLALCAVLKVELKNIFDGGEKKILVTREEKGPSQKLRRHEYKEGPEDDSLKGNMVNSQIREEGVCPAYVE